MFSAQKLPIVYWEVKEEDDPYVCTTFSPFLKNVSYGEEDKEEDLIVAFAGDDELTN